MWLVQLFEMDVHFKLLQKLSMHFYHRYLAYLKYHSEFEISSFHSQYYFLFCNFNVPHFTEHQNWPGYFYTVAQRPKESVTRHTHARWTWKHDEREQQQTTESVSLSCVCNVIRYVLLEACSGEQNWNLKVAVHHIFSKYHLQFVLYPGSLLWQFEDLNKTCCNAKMTL